MIWQRFYTQHKNNTRDNNDPTPETFQYPLMSQVDCNSYNLCNYMLHIESLRIAVYKAVYPTVATLTDVISAIEQVSIIINK